MVMGCWVGFMPRSLVCCSVFRFGISSFGSLLLLVVYVASSAVFLGPFTNNLEPADLCLVSILSSSFWCPLQFHFLLFVFS